MNKTVSNGKIGGSVMPSRLHDTFFNSSELTMTHLRTRSNCLSWFVLGSIPDPIFFPIPLPRFNTGSYYFAIL